MTKFTVSYDLIKRKDYQTLWDELKRLGAHRSQASYWLVSVNQSGAETLHNHLKKFVDADDSIWVSELTKNHYYSNAKAGTNDWIKNNPPAR
jgi:CRISPR-associated endonuclease Cas2